MDREQKTAVVEELAEELKDATAIFAVDYRGISVPQAAELRAGLRDADTRFRVVKNRLTLRAADAAGTDALKDLPERAHRPRPGQGRRRPRREDAQPPRLRVGAARLQGRPDGRGGARPRLLHGDRPPARPRGPQRPARRRRRQPAHRPGPRPRLDDPGPGPAARPDRRAGPGQRRGTPADEEAPAEEEAPADRGGAPRTRAAESPRRAPRRRPRRTRTPARARRPRPGRASTRSAGEEPAEETSEDSDENKEDSE